MKKALPIFFACLLYSTVCNVAGAQIGNFERISQKKLKTGVNSKLQLHIGAAYGTARFHVDGFDSPYTEDEFFDDAMDIRVSVGMVYRLTRVPVLGSSALDICLAGSVEPGLTAVDGPPFRFLVSAGGEVGLNLSSATGGLLVRPLLYLGPGYMLSDTNLGYPAEGGNDEVTASAAGPVFLYRIGIEIGRVGGRLSFVGALQGVEYDSCRNVLRIWQEGDDIVAVPFIIDQSDRSFCVGLRLFL